MLLKDVLTNNLKNDNDYDCDDDYYEDDNNKSPALVTHESKVGHMPTRRREFKIGAWKQEAEDFNVHDQKTKIAMSLCMIGSGFHTTCPNSKEEADDCKRHFSGTLCESHCNIET